MRHECWKKKSAELSCDLFWFSCRASSSRSDSWWAAITSQQTNSSPSSLKPSLSGGLYLTVSFLVVTIGVCIYDGRDASIIIQLGEQSVALFASRSCRAASSRPRRSSCSEDTSFLPRGPNHQHRRLAWSEEVWHCFAYYPKFSCCCSFLHERIYYSSLHLPMKKPTSSVRQQCRLVWTKPSLSIFSKTLLAEPS